MMDKEYLLESLHDLFFEDDQDENLSVNTSNIAKDMETDHNTVEVTSTELREDVVDQNEVELEDIQARNADSDTVDDEENKDLMNSEIKEGMVIVHIDDGVPRPPRQSNSEVVIPYSPEFSPSKSSSSCSRDITTSDYTDSDTDEDNETPVFVIKKIMGSHMSEVSDDESTSPAVGPVFVFRSESVDEIGDGVARTSDAAEHEGSDSDSGRDNSDTSSEHQDREMLFMHYKRANGQSVVEKVYLDISKFVEEHADHLKPRSRSVSSRGFRQSSSVTTAVRHHERKTSVTHRANSAHCIVSTEKKTARSDAAEASPIRNTIYTPASPSDTQSCTKSGSDSENEGRDSVPKDALTANTEDTRESDEVQQDDLKMKHYNILPDIGKENIALQGNTSQASSLQTTRTSVVVPKKLYKSATQESKHCTSRKPGIPHQLKTVACYQDGKVNVSILGDQRIFCEREPPHLNITFVHRPEPPIKKSVKVTDDTEAKATDTINVAEKQRAKLGRQTSSASRKPLPPIRNNTKSGQRGNVQKVTKPVTKPHTHQIIPRSAKKILPPLKGVPKLNHPRNQKRNGKRFKTRPVNFTSEYGLPMPRKLNGINRNVVDTRAQWPPFNTHLDPEASERHRRMITALPV